MIKGPIQTTRVNDYGYAFIKVNGTWFGADKKGEIDLSEGDFVEFEAFDKPGKNGKAYPTFKFPTLKVSEPPKAAPAATGSGKTTRDYKPAPNAREDYWTAKAKDDTAKEPRISYMAGYERAISFTALALANGAFTALEKAKPAAKLEILEAFVDGQATRIMAAAYAAKVPQIEEESAEAEAGEDAETEDASDAEGADEGKWS